MRQSFSIFSRNSHFASRNHCYPRHRQTTMASTGHTAFSSKEIIAQAAACLAAADPRLAPLVAEFGPPERLLAKNTSCFRSLAKSILYQQLAGTAAAAIYSRFLAVCGVPDESALTPAAVLAAEPAALRGCGLSERKASYLQDLAAHFYDGRLSDELLTSLPDAALLSTLTAVRGIGPWTVDMFAMFHLGRPDVLPVGDLGVRKGLAHICGLSQLPSPSQMEALTAHWRPYRSLGCYYMWRVPLPAAKRPAAANSGSQAAKAKKAKQAAVASPLGAAVAAVADVGVNPDVPMLAAAGVASGVASAAAGAVRRVATVGGTAGAAAGPSSAWGCREEQQQQQQKRKQKQQAVPAAVPPITPPKLPTVGATAAGEASSNGSTTAGSHGSSHSMMTRRRLKWAAGEIGSTGVAQHSADAAGYAELKPRIVDL